MTMGVYDECLRSKEIAAKVLLPLIEFEFGFIGDDKPTLVQSTGNVVQLKKVYDICKEHGWTTSQNLLHKKGNPYFRISIRGFREIYEIAGPFADPIKDQWARLLLERAGKRGGYKGGEQPTIRKLLYLFMRNSERKWKVEDICFELRILPGTVRSALRTLEKSGLIRRIRAGKSIYYTLAAV